MRIDISADGGKFWQQAEMLEDDVKGSKLWAWKRWKHTMPRKLAGNEFAVKTVDEGYITQPESHERYYNFRGNLTNGWHRVPVARV